MKRNDVQDYLNWLWYRMKEEPEFEKAFNEIQSFKRRVLEREAEDKLEDWEKENRSKKGY